MLGLIQLRDHGVKNELAMLMYLHIHSLLCKALALYLIKLAIFDYKVS